ncbi:MAG: hypothetical protein V4536_08855 [Pseudomonadota bacterium]
MSLLSLLTGRVAIIRSIDGYVFDAVFSEEHEAQLEVTDNPVETGVVVSDHAFMKPLKVKIKAGVSDAVLNPITRFYGVDQFSGGTSRSKRAFDLLCDLQKSAEPFDVQTGLKLYKNMVCTSIRTSQDSSTSSALIFEAELREVIIVNTESVTYPPRSKARQAQKPKDGGEKQGAEVPATESKGSLLKSAAKSLGFGK